VKQRLVTLPAMNGRATNGTRGAKADGPLSIPIEKACLSGLSYPIGDKENRRFERGFQGDRLGGRVQKPMTKNSGGW